MSTRFPRVAVVGTAAAVALLSGCGLNSEIATLKPVAGDAITELNVAVNDVLLDGGVELLVVPTCTYDAQRYECHGTTTAGQKVTASAQGASPETFTVTVGSRTVFSGSIDDVIERAGQR